MQIQTDNLNAFLKEWSCRCQVLGLTDVRQNSDYLANVKSLAFELHSGQTRADGKTPYITHPELVAKIVSDYTTDVRLIAVAWLHDIIEESFDRIKQAFKGLIHLSTDDEYVQASWNDAMYLLTKDYQVAAGILRLTDSFDYIQKYIKTKGKVEYLSLLLSSLPTGYCLVKLCDMLANMRESNGTRMSQETRYFKAICNFEKSSINIDGNCRAVINRIKDTYAKHSTKINN